MFDYDYPIALFLSEPQPHLDGLLAAASLLFPTTSAVAYVYTSAAPEVPATISDVRFTFSSALTVPAQTNVLDNMVANYVNPAPSGGWTQDYQESNFDGGSSSATFVALWTSNPLDNCLTGESWMLFVSVLVNNASTTQVTSLRWLIETAANVFTELSAFYPTFSCDNASSNTIGFPCTSFYLTTPVMDTPRIQLQQRTSASTPDITEPKVFGLKLS